MFDYCYLTNEKGEPVAVNPQLVRYVRQSKSADHVAIVFDSEHALVVQGTVPVVADQLRKAIR